MKKRFILLFMLFLFERIVWACPVCEKQQPAITRGFTHGIGPQSNWDWLIISLIAAITVFTFIFSLKFLLKPGEKSRNHIKNSILDGVY